jgi:tetratricopeptide (TPR) repeat protein
MIFRYISIIILLISTISASNGQTPDIYIKYGDLSYSERDFYGASIYYKKAMVLDSSDLNTVHKYAESLRLYNEYKLAEHYYQYVYKLDQKRQFPESLFWLATMQKHNANYNASKANFTRFASSYKNKKSYYYLKAQQEIGSCEYAIELMKDTLPVEIINAGPPINTVDSEFGAYQFSDSNLIFSTLRTEQITDEKEVKDKNYLIRIFQSELINGEETIKPFSNNINEKGFHSANGTFSKNKEEFYFTRCDKDYMCQIYLSKKEEGKWQVPIPINELNAEGSTSTQPSLTSIDGTEILFFASNRQGGFGKMDIWYSIKKDGQFMPPVNAGPEINSIDDEITPFYDSKNKTLYFSSNWHYGLGGFDIFKSTGSIRKLSKPENLGYPLNTSTNDLYYITKADFTGGYLTSNRSGSITAKGETCCNDIWFFNHVEKPKEEVVATAPTRDSILEKKTQELENIQQKLNLKLPVTLYFHNDHPNPRSWDTITKLNYIETYDHYLSTKEEYLKATKNENNNTEDLFQNYVQNGFQKLKEATPLLLEALQKGYTVEVFVSGFASPLAKTDYNVNLTSRRISSFINYLTEYNEGVFLPFLKEKDLGTLRIIKLPMGEYTSSNSINDDLNNKRLSVYSQAAALERKIEIATVSVSLSDTLFAKLYIDQATVDMKTQTVDTPQKVTITLTNKGNKEVVISDILCPFETEMDTKIIHPGEKTLLTVHVNFRNPGKQVHELQIISNNISGIRKILISAEVVE